MPTKREGGNSDTKALPPPTDHHDQHDQANCAIAVGDHRQDASAHGHKDFPGTATEANSTNNLEGITLEDHDSERQPRHVNDRIYSRGAWLYRGAGWRGVLPLPPGKKFPPPSGFTGYDGEWPTDEKIRQWVAKESPNGNLGLRMDYGFVGIDVDAYGDKTGALALAEAERRWGALPPTYRSTARIDDAISGIRVFKVPLGVLLRGDLKFVLDDGRKVGHIEIIQPHHRLVVCWPSIHPKTGCVYQWFAPDGTLLGEGVVPRVEDISDLPERWVEELSRDAVRDEVFNGSCLSRTRAARERINEELYQKLIGLADNGPPDPLVQARLDKALAELEDGSSSRYDITRDHAAALMRFHGLGRAGVPSALEELFAAYVMQVADTRLPVVAGSEFLRFTQGAAALVAATMPSGSSGTRGADGPDAAAGNVETQDESPSWRKVDLTELLSGTREQLRPTLFQRSDGQCLLYPGMTHSFHGESESGKSLVIQAECICSINQGRDVLYVDFDSDTASVVDRLLEFGGSPQAVAEHFHYLQPEVKPDSADHERRAWEDMLCRPYALAVIDGVTDALGIFGYSSKDNDEVARWIRKVPKLIAARTGAAVVLIDHVTKDTSTRNRWAIGGQAKMAGLTGAAYTVEVAAPLGRGLRGEVVLKVAKDRPGSVRPNCGPFSKKDRTQEAARVVIDSTVSPATITVCAPLARSDGESRTERQFRPTNLMQRVSEGIEQRPGQLTQNQAVMQAGGRKSTTREAFQLLDDEGYLTSERGRGGYAVYTVVKPYRETDDPLSDRYVNFGNSHSAD